MGYGLVSERAQEQALIDPMCGSSTLLLEALMALDRAPGLTGGASASWMGWA